MRENQEVHPETLVLDAEPDADAVENHADADGVPALKSPFSWNSVHTTLFVEGGGGRRIATAGADVAPGLGGGGDRQHRSGVRTVN